ncbi:MAG: DUF2141 domain-containing protein [Sphingobium sp.]
MTGIMKTMLLSLPLLLLATVLPPAALAQTCTGEKTAGSVKLELEATHVRSGGGEVAFTVYGDDPKRFMAPRGKLLRARVPAVAPVTRACFWLPPGRYATTQYHDENGDRKFNRFLLTPKEGVGVSNDVKSGLVPPLKDVLFTLPPEGRTVRMTMRYPG